jgi:hypothetical protein
MAAAATVQASGPGPEHHMDRVPMAATSSSTLSTAPGAARALSPSTQSVGSVKRKRDDDADADVGKPGAKDGDAGSVAVTPSPTTDPADIVEIPQNSKAVIVSFYRYLRRYGIWSPSTAISWTLFS